MSPHRPDLIAIAKIQAKAHYYRTGNMSGDEFAREALAIIDELEAELDRIWAEAEAKAKAMLKEQELRKEGA